MVKIDNTGPVMAADLNTLGAAVKILAAGGPDLSESEMKRACGASYHLWQKKGAAIRELVQVLTPQGV